MIQSPVGSRAVLTSQPPDCQMMPATYNGFVTRMESVRWRGGGHIQPRAASFVTLVVLLIQEAYST